MRLFDKVHQLAPQCRPDNLKIQLMNNNGIIDPIKMFRRGELRQWQSAQPDPNLNRRYVLNLIKLPNKNHWLFAGINLVKQGPVWGASCYSVNMRWLYDLRQVVETSNLEGKLTVVLDKPATNSFLNGENFYDRITLAEL